MQEKIQEFSIKELNKEIEENGLRVSKTTINGYGDMCYVKTKSHAKILFQIDECCITRIIHKEKYGRICVKLSDTTIKELEILYKSIQIFSDYKVVFPDISKGFLRVSLECIGKKTTSNIKTIHCGQIASIKILIKNIFNEKPTNDWRLIQYVQHIEVVKNFLTNNNIKSEKFYDRKDVFDSTECVCCMDSCTDVVFRPCNHAACCNQCSIIVNECPICREKIVSIEKLEPNVKND